VLDNALVIDAVKLMMLHQGSVQTLSIFTTILLLLLLFLPVVVVVIVVVVVVVVIVDDHTCI
jgi:hypothetical protein